MSTGFRLITDRDGTRTWERIAPLPSPYAGTDEWDATATIRTPQPCTGPRPVFPELDERYSRRTIPPVIRPTPAPITQADLVDLLAHLDRYGIR